MRFKIMIGVTALALGVALASVPANAGPGIPGYSPDGAVVAVHKHHQTRARPVYNSVRQHEQQGTSDVAVPGRNPNDGGAIK
jgi:hypothetical protein